MGQPMNPGSGGQQGGSGPVPDGMPGETFPTGTMYAGREGAMTHLGAGAFGDVWEAVDESTGESVAVKVFYKKLDAEGTRKEYITWNRADQHDKDEMRKNVKECKLIRKIITDGYAMNAPGASRICSCDAEYITPGMTTNKDAVMYTVWEMCGKSMEKLRVDMETLSPSKRIEVARHLTKQLLQGVALMQMFNPPLIHHDMKPDNTVVRGDINDIASLEVKLIDFGCYVSASPENKRSQSTGDPKYMPPELSQTIAFDNAKTFDMWGVGLTHMELLCPALEKEDWCPFAMYEQEAKFNRFARPPAFNIEKCKAGIKKRCAGITSRAAEDIAFITSCTQHSSHSRPTAAQALTVPLFASLPEPVSQAPESVPCSGSCGSIDESLHIDKPLVFEVGDEVEYYSTSKGYWFKCEIAATSQGDDVTNSYSLKWPADDTANPPGNTFKTNVLPERVRVRTFPQYALVAVRGSSGELLTGVVMNYDDSTEIYTLSFPEYQNQQKPVSRSDVLRRFGSFNTGAEVMYYDAERDPARGSRERKAVVTAHDQNAETYTIMLLSIHQGEASQRSGISRTLLWEA